MSIKSTEMTELQSRRINGSVYVINLKRSMQLRKRSLTSMGWRYHV